MYQEKSLTKEQLEIQKKFLQKKHAGFVKILNEMNPLVRKILNQQTKNSLLQSREAILELSKTLDEYTCYDSYNDELSFLRLQTIEYNVMNCIADCYLELVKNKLGKSLIQDK